LRGVFVLLLAGLFGGTASAAEVVPWLYEVSVPVAGQSTEERQQASSEALFKLLTRMTGLAHVPRSPEVAEALAATDRFYNEFRYAEGEDEGLELVVQFDPNPVLDLIRAAGLPIWRATRERVVVWMVVQEGGERSLVGATTPSPLVEGLERQALERGLPLTLPLLDLEDQLVVDPAAVWGRLSDVVDPASARYGADVLLLGRVVDAVDGYESQWEFWVDGVVVPFDLEGPDLNAHAVEAVNVLADELAARRIIHGREVGQLAVVVSGVASPDDYGALLRYVRSLEFVDQVGVVGLTGARLWLTIATPAGPDQLLAAFERDGWLFDDQLTVLSSADLRLIWRGSD
jgi:hypothetical protein